MTIAPREIEQEAMRILRRLTGSRTVLARLPGGEGFGVFSARNKWARPVMRTSEAFATAFLRRELIAATEEAIRAGRRAPRRVIVSRGSARRF